MSAVDQSVGALVASMREAERERAVWAEGRRACREEGPNARFAGTSTADHAIWLAGFAYEQGRRRAVRSWPDR